MIARLNVSTRSMWGLIRPACITRSPSIRPMIRVTYSYVKGKLMPYFSATQGFRPWGFQESSPGEDTPNGDRYSRDIPGSSYHSTGTSQEGGSSPASGALLALLLSSLLTSRPGMSPTLGGSSDTSDSASGSRESSEGDGFSWIKTRFADAGVDLPDFDDDDDDDFEEEDEPEEEMIPLAKARELSASAFNAGKAAGLGQALGIMLGADK